MIFDEKYLGIKLLNSSSSLLDNVLFDIVPNFRSMVPLLSISIGLSTSLPE